MLDLLTEPIVGVSAASGTQMVTLPELFAGLVKGGVLGYPGLRPHQADPWHAFLVQVAASVLARSPRDAITSIESSFWHDGLLDLADGEATAWQLIVEDATRPAFMQHPLGTAAELNTWKVAGRTPDEIDVLVTAKDHDVKSSRVASIDAEAWLFALVTCQTTSGFFGAGKYGSIRMNGGFGSRAFVSLVTDPSPSSRFQEELRVVGACRGAVLAGGYGYRSKGCVLTWLKPWRRDASQWMLSELEPWFVEAVRPLRLRSAVGGIEALGTTSDARQIGPKSVDGGDVGDPWCPTNLADKKKGRSALTVSGSGWSPELLCRLLFQQEVELTPLQRPRPGMPTAAWLVGSVLVRGQGTTEGFRRFVIEVPAGVRGWLERPDDRERLSKLAQQLLGDAKEVERTLRAAVMVLADGGPDQVDRGNDTLATWARKVVDQEALGWGDRFFTMLWRATAEDPEIVRASWCTDLVARARLALADAERRVPLKRNRQYRALVRARGTLEGSLRKKGLVPHPAESATEETFV
jgi:CRISPR system Cascade subunit CasA